MRALAILAGSVPLFAHAISISTGELHLQGSNLTYELRIPSYEASHVAHPETALLNAIHFRSGWTNARVLNSSCQDESGTYTCRETLEFPAPIASVQVECKLAGITVPNHVHLLRASSGGRWDQAAFDASFTTAELRFRPPGAFEPFIRDAGSGFWRAVSGIAQILLLLALALAARSGREMVALGTIFAGGQVAAFVVSRATGVWLSPRFLEAAVALTVAYLAVELLVVPGAGARWAIAGALGMFQGLYFAMILSATDSNPISFAGGVLMAEAAIAFLLWFCVRILRRTIPSGRFQWQSAFAVALLGVGLGWFLLRIGS